MGMWLLHAVGLAVPVRGAAGGEVEGVTPYYQADFCTLYLADCLPAMREMPDKAFDLAIVDPPYGIGFDGEIPEMSGTARADRWSSPKVKGYPHKQWDSGIPCCDYFDEILRVTRNQIIWGGNYFSLRQSSGWIFWDKGVAESFSLGDGELAWTSFNHSVKLFKFLWAGFRKGEPCNRIHPTQKPVALYRWLLTNYAKPGDTILDTHLGSGSIAIACHDLGFHLTGYEIDEEYLAGAVERIKRHLRQGKLFAPPRVEQVQESLL